MVTTEQEGGGRIFLPPLLSTSVKSPEKVYEGLFAVGLMIESALIESEGVTVIFADTHSLSAEYPSEKF